MGPAIHTGNRQSVTFCLNGLSARDETLFKSFVRLLAHRTMQQWTCVPHGGNVCVAAQDTVPHILAGQKMLVVGPSHHGESHFVSIPFHADALEQVLNDIGASFSATRPAAANLLASAGTTTPFRLLRWPPSELLKSTDHMRLATMMTGKVTTLAGLQERAGVPLQICSQFMADLQHAGLLVDAAPALSPATHEAMAGAAAARHVEAGLISRIRSRLGLFSAGRT